MLPGVHIMHKQSIPTITHKVWQLIAFEATNIHRFMFGRHYFFVLSSSIALALPGQWSSHLSGQIPTDMLGMVHLHHRHVCDEIPLPWHWISGLGPGKHDVDVDVIGCGSKMIQIPTQALALAQPTAPPARPEWSAPPLGQFLASVASWEGRIIGRSRICRQLWANRSQSPGNSAVDICGKTTNPW